MRLAVLASLLMAAGCAHRHAPRPEAPETDLTVFFRPGDHHRLDDAATARMLDKVIAAMNASQTSYLHILGHASHEEQDCQALAEKRVRWTAGYLINHGAPPRRIKTAEACIEGGTPTVDLLLREKALWPGLDRDSKESPSEEDEESD